MNGTEMPNRKNKREITMWDFGRKSSWKKTIWNLSKRYGRKECFRTLSISVAILIVTILFTSLLTLYVGVVLSVGRYEIEHYGTEAHGEVFNVPKDGYKALKADKGVKDTAYSRMVGTVSLEVEDSKRYYLYYDEPKSLEWEGVEIVGQYPQGEQDIVVSTHFLQSNGLERQINQPIKLSYTVMGREYVESFNIVGYYSSKQIVASEGNYDGTHYPGTYEKIYISQELCHDKLSSYSEKKIEKYFDADKTNGDGLYQVQIKFVHNYGLSHQAETLERKYNQRLKFSGIYLNGGWTRIDPMGRDSGNYIIIFMAVLLISLVGIFVIYSIFQIPIMEDARFWGLLQTLGVSAKQYRYFLFQQLQTYAIYGILFGGVVGYAVGYAIIPQITVNFYTGDVSRYMPFQLWIPCVCIAASLLVSYICCFRVAEKVAGLSPVELERLREESIKTGRRKKLYLGKYKSCRFAWKRVLTSRSKTRAVVASFLFLLILIMMVSTFLQSINFSHYVQEQLDGLDNVVLSKNAMDGEELQECTPALEALEEDCELRGSRIGRLEKQLTIFDTSALEEQQEIYDTVQVERYLSENGFFNPNLSEHLAYLSVFGFDSDIVRQMDVVEGEIDADKYASGNYVILTAGPACLEDGGEFGMEEESENLLCALYDVGDQIELYGRTYEVMAVVDIPYVICSYDISNDLRLIMPYDEATDISEEFYTYGAVYPPEALEDEVIKEKLINHILTDQNETLEYVSRNRVEEELKAISKMMYIICTLVLLFIMTILMIHAVNVSAFSIQNEKHTFAVLQSIGMLRRQQREQICLENIFQLGISFVAAMVVGSVISLTVVRALCNATAICVYHYSVLPVIVTSIFLSIGMSVSAVGSYNGIWKKYHMMDLVKDR